MRILFFSSKSYDRHSFESTNARFGHSLHFVETPLTEATVALAKDFPAVCVFVNDQLGAGVLEKLVAGGTRFLLLRCAGYNHVDRAACARLGLNVAYVPRYSPHSVAEHAVALMLTLNRRTHRAYARVREGNFSIEGLLGFDFNGRTVGVIGLGKIGRLVAKIMRGFGCTVIAYDAFPPADIGGEVTMKASVREVLGEADVVSLHCPLTPETKHLINSESLGWVKPGLMLINTSRGGLVDTAEAVEALKSGRLGSLGIDVYEEEAAFFYEDLSDQIIADDVLARLMTFPNVLVTSHQGFFTEEALSDIATATLQSAADFEAGRESQNGLKLVS
jgi:D-lactate dehydrogenase